MFHHIGKFMESDQSFFNCMEEYKDETTFLDLLDERLSKGFFNQLEKESKNQEYKAAFAKVFKKFPGKIISQYYFHYNNRFSMKKEPLPQILKDYIDENRENIFADLENKEKLSGLAITSCVRGQTVTDSKQKYPDKDEKKKPEQLTEEKKTTSKYPHRVAAIVDVIRKTVPQTVEEELKDFDHKNDLSNSPYEKAISIIRKATDALNHPKNYYRFWSRSDKTNVFYNKAIDDLVEVDAMILHCMRDSLIEKFAQQAKQNNVFDLGWLGSLGGVRHRFTYDLSVFQEYTARVPTRLRDIFVQLEIACKSEKPAEIKNAIREIAKSAAEALNDGNGSQTISTRKMYYEILANLVKKEEPLVLNKTTYTFSG